MSESKTMSKKEFLKWLSALPGEHRDLLEEHNELLRKHRDLLREYIELAKEHQRVLKKYVLEENTELIKGKARTSYIS